MFITRKLKILREMFKNYFSMRFFAILYLKSKKHFSFNYIFRNLLILNVFIQFLLPSGILFSYIKYSGKLYYQKIELTKLKKEIQILDQSLKAIESGQANESILFQYVGQSDPNIEIILLD